MKPTQAEHKEQKSPKYKFTPPLAIKPGTYSDYLNEHPEVVDAGLRRMGIDPDELDRLLDGEGAVVTTFNSNFRNATLTRIEEEA